MAHKRIISDLYPEDRECPVTKLASNKKKRSAPQKTCTGCGTSCHARVSKCADCGYEFYVKKSTQAKLLAENWKDLQAGDIIKCITGSGPYFLSKDRPGEKIMMGHKGIFEIVEMYNNGPKSCGIVARQLSGRMRRRRSGVVEYIYMGETWYNDDLSQHEVSHKIKVIKSSKRVDKHDAA